MEESTSSGEFADVVLKNRSSSGCLVIRKKGDRIGGVGNSLHRPNVDWSKEKKRLRLIGTDSDVSDERLDPYRRRVVSRVGNGYGEVVEKSYEVGRMRSGLDHIDFMSVENESERNTSRLGGFEVDGYEAVVGRKLKKHMADDDNEGGGNSFFGTKADLGAGIRREYEVGSSKRDIVQKRNHLYFDRASDYDNVRRYGTEGPIRVQGKNGVLKVMPNKNKKGSGVLKTYNNFNPILRSKDTVKSNELVCPFNYEQKNHNKDISLVREEKHRLDLQKETAAEKIKALDWESDTSDTVLKLGNKKDLLKASVIKNSKALDLQPDSSDTSLKLGRNTSNLKKSLKSKTSEALDWESDNSDSSLKLGPNKPKGHKSVWSKGEVTPPSEKIPTYGSNVGKIRRGSGTEKQKLREQIRKMLLDAGWTIDYRPRKNRDYQDAVYMSPSGTAYWSIIKAYEALQKQFNAEDDCLKPDGESLFSPISEHVLSKLTRQTQKKIEKEMKRKKRHDDATNNAPEHVTTKSAKHKHDSVRNGGLIAVDKSSSLVNQGCILLKDRKSEKALKDSSRDIQNETNYTSEDTLRGMSSNSEGKFRKLNICTLVVRSNNKGQNLETDGYVPYTGKRTLLSWLIDSGMVRLSEKVQYMNRKQTRVMQEGWITRDGIHCGCCSKILTVTKFEIHAGSKLHQPYQNIYLESGTSLLQCQMDAWKREEESKRRSFHSVYVDSDDPNDDTCGICGDGGDLICCDGCPSTFHLTCLGIQMLPEGDWHCHNCTCKFCGMAGSNSSQGNEIICGALPMCSLCERKYHQSCIKEVDALPVDSTCPPFCGKKCREMFETLQKFSGVKHELEGGYSWSLIHRTDTDSDTSVRGLAQKVECNSKLAVALTVMDECFLPVVDRRSGINLIHKVLFNWGSNFNRINYRGFYTAILERGDEIIAAASIRFHGIQLAEMPLIATRHIYRRQGMCQRLFSAIELALCSFKVENLIIPAVPECMRTWTEVFGFNYLEESQKEELRSLNVLVFLGIDMLGKILTHDKNTHPNATSSTDVKSMELEGKQSPMDDMPNKSFEFEDKSAAFNFTSQGSGVTLNDVSVPSTLDAPHGNEFTLSSPYPHPGGKVSESVTEDNLILDGDSKSSNDINVTTDKNCVPASAEPVSHSYENVSAQKITGATDEIKDYLTDSSCHGNKESTTEIDKDLNLIDPFEKESKQLDASKGYHDLSGECGLKTDSPIRHNLFDFASHSGTNLIEVKTRPKASENFAKNGSELTKIENDPAFDTLVGGDISKPTMEVSIVDLSLNGVIACVDSSGERELKTGSIRHNLFESASDSGTNLIEVKIRSVEKGFESTKIVNEPTFDLLLGGDNNKSRMEVNVEDLSVKDAVSCDVDALHPS